MKQLAQIDIGEKFFGPGSTTKLKELTGVGSLVTTVVQIAFALAGIVFIVLLIVGGIGMIAGAGRDDPEQAAKGKQAATSALIGFIVVFVAYWIVQLIEVLTGISILQ